MSILGKPGALAVALAAALEPSSARAAELFDGRLELRFLAMQNFQAIQAKEGAFHPENEDQSDGFGRPRVNLQLKFFITDFITADVDIAEEPNDFGGGDRDFSFHQDYGGIEFEFLGIFGKPREDADLLLRVGNIGKAPFQFKGFQDGADNQSNPLIGNGITDYATAENGLDLRYSKSFEEGTIRFFTAHGQMTTSSFGEAFQDGRGYNFTLQGAVEFAGGFKAGLGILTADQGGQLVFEDGLASLVGVTTTNYRFGDGENYNFTSSPSNARDTHVGVMPGLDQKILQLNLAYQPSPNTSVIFMVGESTDDFTFADAVGNPLPGIKFFGVDGVEDPAGTGMDSTHVIAGDTSVEYYTIEAQQYLVPEKFYLAARYAEAENTSALIDQTDNVVERLQVSAGFWLNDKTLWKFEYVDQDEGVNSGGQIGRGFSGFTSELSVKFD